MKTISTFIVLILISTWLQGCSVSKGTGSTSVPAGASATFDALNISGNHTIPTGGCSIATWVNTINSNQNGTLDCAGGGGFSGTGIATNPYRVEFNGTSTKVATNINLQPNTIPSTTWIIWVYPTSTSFQQVLSIDDHMGAYNRSLVIQNSNWAAYTGTTTSFEATSVDLNTWQQIALVYTANNIILYKNGTAFSRGSAPTINNTANTLAIGRSGGGLFDFFQGAIAWISIYPRALSQTEISSTCNALVARFNGVLCN